MLVEGLPGLLCAGIGVVSVARNECSWISSPCNSSFASVCVLVFWFGPEIKRWMLLEISEVDGYDGNYERV